jgi:lipoprotein-anchoring transpeptidase ErfK/SrfK
MSKKGIKSLARQFLIPLSLLFISNLWAAPALTSSNPQVTARPSYLAKAIQRLQQSNRQWIEIDLRHQRLVAWDGPSPSYAVLVSTGKSSTPTPTGVFSVQSRYRYARMQGEDYDIADVPYTLYFVGGYAIHGAYWHHRFGTPISHGCVNVAVNHARWLFYWAPVGTPVVVHK